MTYHADLVLFMWLLSGLDEKVWAGAQCAAETVAPNEPGARRSRQHCGLLLFVWFFFHNNMSRQIFEESRKEEGLLEYFLFFGRLQTLTVWVSAPQAWASRGTTASTLACRWTKTPWFTWCWPTTSFIAFTLTASPWPRYKHTHWRHPPSLRQRLTSLFTQH